MPNRLADENSPYLLQHKNNPVDWYPWGEEALSRAQREDKPIFLSIGYAACHWCHVMEHESFEDPDTAALMNELFVNVKVDREERPDLDNIYMKAVVALTGHGGWPMSVFLTPEGEPFYGGTYFPPVRRHNMPAFQEILRGVAHAWQHDRENIENAGQKLQRQVELEFTQLKGPAGLDPGLSDRVSMGLAQGYDWKHGGWGKAPKFPQPMVIGYLLRRAQRGDKFALEMASHALDAMAKGGMYDVVGGGFSRYSVDDHWLVPHFEKMLYDNAQLASAYLHAYLLSGKQSYRRIVEETLDFIMREMTHPDGGFYSSLDADSEGQEGKFYIWTPQEIEEALGEAEAAFVTAAYGVTDNGNFEGATILQRSLSDEELADQFGMPAGGNEQLAGQNGPPTVIHRLQRAHRKLLEYREGRIRPGTDDKVLVSWNALALVAFSEAGRYLGISRYVDLAMRNADFLLEELREKGRLLRSWRKGQARHNAYLEDYAGLILGLLALYQTDPQPRWYAAAEQLTHEMLAHFQDPQGGFFDTRDDHETLIVRPKDQQDNATPSGNALAATALLLMSAYSGEGSWRDLAEKALSPLQPIMARYPTGFGQWLTVHDLATGPLREVAILGPPGAGRQSLVQTLWSQYRPRLVAAISDLPLAGQSPALLHNRTLLEDRPTAYLCQDFVCRQPVNTPAALGEQLDQAP